MPRTAAWLAWGAAALWLGLHPQPVRAAYGVLEGDTGVELYVNSYYMFSDPVMPVLLMNSERRFNVGDYTAWQVALQEQLVPGDIVALKASTVRPNFVPITLPTLKVEVYPGIAGVIAAFDDGTITNSDWRCRDHILEEEEDTWYTARYDDSSWPYAIEQPHGCCPWRDTVHKWKRFGARWISPPRQNASGPRQFYCRYQLPNGTKTGLMDNSNAMADESMDGVLRIKEFQVARSQVVIWLDIREPVLATCGLIDARFQLRPPSPKELRNWGSTAAVGNSVIWEDVTGANIKRVNTLPALAESDEPRPESCKAKCTAHNSCNGISYRVAGHSSTVLNCQLLAEIDPYYFVDAPNPSWQFVYLEQRRSLPQVVLTDTLLMLGTLYNAYCMATHPVSGKHSTWSALAATLTAQRTQGCFNCGGLEVPEAEMQGGFATNDTITAIVKSSKAGRVVCAARAIYWGMQPMSPQDVIAVGSFELVIVDGVSVPIVMTGLTANTEHDVSCVAESQDGGISTEENLQRTRRRWRTESFPTTIAMLTLRHLRSGPDLVIETSARVDDQGYLFCQVYNESHIQENGVPDFALLEETGFSQEIEDVKVDALGMFPGLDPAISYEVYCSAAFVDLANISAAQEMALGGPKATIVRSIVNYDEVQLKVLVQYGPARVYCQAQRWSVRPNSERPPVPTQKRMRASPFKKDADSDRDVYVEIAVTGLATGSWHDLYCFAEELLPEPPPGSAPPPAIGMAMEDVRARRILIRTPGPEFREEGWRCVAGVACGISGLSGEGLGPFDQVLARSKGCPGTCRCNGLEDEDNKGAECSAVSHSRAVRAPDPSNNSYVDKADPRGAWCYVRPMDCPDEEPSPTFPSKMISYFACQFGNLAVRPGAEPSGFLNEGLATQVAVSDTPDGTSFSWGRSPLFVPGAPYSLCWCNGTTSACRYERDFRLRIGLLHVAGPTAKQLDSNPRCLAGQSCIVGYFHGHAIAVGNRLAVLKSTPLGCAWEKPEPNAPPGVVGFPYFGLSEPASDGGRVFSWGAEPVRALGGIYLLCWCGAEKSFNVTACPSMRPDGGQGFLAPAGQLEVVGPSNTRKQICLVGTDCVIEDVMGIGLAGGDRVAVLEECGQPSGAPANWTMGAPAAAAQQVQPGWLEGGWFMYVLSENNTAFASHGGLHGDLAANAGPPRGVWGFANRGLSVPTPQAGHYAWHAPSLAFAGIYSLCWCAGHAVCEQPGDFQMYLGELRLRGPLVLPSASQAFICVRGRACELQGLVGLDLVTGTKLLVASNPCGNGVSPGMPRDGISIASSDGSSFSWGPKAITTVPGELDCILTGIDGEGLSSGDRVMAMVSCGEGLPSSSFADGAISVETGSDGSWFKLPPARAAGSDRVCWCPEEALCVSGVDFYIDIGALIVGGPEAFASYSCFDWQPCEIPAIQGVGGALSDGDRLWVVPPGAPCGQGSSLAHNSGFPGQGLAFPATEDGRRHSWGSQKIRAPAGMYLLCFCSRLLAPGGICNESAPYDIRAGVLKVGTAKEYIYANRPPDPEPRSNDAYFGYVLAAVLPILFLSALACFAGMKLGKTGGPAVDPETIRKEAFKDEAKNQAKVSQGISQLSMLRRIVLGKFGAEGKKDQKKERNALEDEDFWDKKSPSKKVAIEMLENGRPEDKLPAIADSLASLSNLPCEVPQDPVANQKAISGGNELALAEDALAAVEDGASTWPSHEESTSPTTSSQPSSPLRRLSAAGGRLSMLVFPSDDVVDRRIRTGQIYHTRKTLTPWEAEEVSRFSTGSSRHRLDPSPPENAPPRLYGSAQSMQSMESMESLPPAPPPEPEPVAPPPPALPEKWRAVQDRRLLHVMELHDYGKKRGVNYGQVEQDPRGSQAFEQDTRGSRASFGTRESFASHATFGSQASG